MTEDEELTPDPKQQQKAVQRARDLDTALSAMMSRRETRLWLWDLIENKCHLNHPIFRTNPQQMAHAEGERNIGLQVLAQIVRVDPDNYLAMIKESARV